MQLLRVSKWQIQAVALDTIPRLYERQSTIDFMKQNTFIYLQMWEKISDNNKNVRQLAIQAMVWLS